MVNYEEPPVGWCCAILNIYLLSYFRQFFIAFLFIKYVNPIGFLKHSTQKQKNTVVELDELSFNVYVFLLAGN